MSDKTFNNLAFLKAAPEKPGVYQMYGDEGDVIYIGKAKNLKKRLSSYFQKNHTDEKLIQLVANIQNIKVTLTKSESDALLLEQNLISQIKPRYNVFLKDDKSYPYLLLSNKHPFPRLQVYRGSRSLKGRYFGPYPNARAVYETQTFIQKVFKLRQCNETFFKNRTRPCLQYQIKRCSAPCVDYISKEDYAQSVDNAKLFLEGKDKEVLGLLTLQMQQASKRQEYELAALYRDQVTRIQKLIATQELSTGESAKDFFALVKQHGNAFCHVITARGGRITYSESFRVMHAKGRESALLKHVIAQYYLKPSRADQIPDEILVNFEVEEGEGLIVLLSDLKKKKISIRHKLKGQNLKLIQMATESAQNALSIYTHTEENLNIKLSDFCQVFSLNEVPKRFECFDISHLFGDEPVGSCVVFTPEGPQKSEYRQYNIKDVTKGDDYEAMYQAVYRHFKKRKVEGLALSDVLIIDGGKNQLNKAKEALEELQITEVFIIAISKGASRKPGLETLHTLKNSDIVLKEDSEALHLIQQIRDEAHKFALSRHVKRRNKKHKVSSLEDIPGIGPKKRKMLLTRFGGLQKLINATVDEISQTPGINKALAKRIQSALKKA